MLNTQVAPLIRFQHLPASLPAGGAIGIELQEGIPVLRASPVVRERIETLLLRQREQHLSNEEQDELDSYEKIDDYLSLLNRMTRNLYLEAGNN